MTLKITFEIDDPKTIGDVIAAIAGVDSASIVSKSDPSPKQTKPKTTPKTKPESAPAIAASEGAGPIDDAPAFTKDQVSQALRKVAKKNRAGALAVLKKFGVTQVGEIDPARYPEVMAELGTV